MHSSAHMSGSPFCRQAATVAPILIGVSVFAVLGAGIGSLRGNGGGGAFIKTRLRPAPTRSR